MRLIADVYRLLYKISGAGKFSFISALLYLTLLNLITLRGLGLLLEGLAPTRMLHILFRFPYIVITTAIMLLINLLSMMPLRNLKKERKKQLAFIPIIIYTVVCILLAIYIRYSTILFS